MKNEEKTYTLNPHSKVILLSVMILLLGITSVFAITENFGTFKQTECINLKQTCSNCTYINITSIQIDGISKQVLNQVAMTLTGSEYNYSFCSTSTIGSYIVNGKFDNNGVNQVWAYNFEVTPSGFTDTLGFYILIVVISTLVIFGGFLIKDAWIVILGTFGLYFIGIYIIINGIAGIRDLTTTLPIGIIILGIAGYISIKSAIETLGDD